MGISSRRWAVASTVITVIAAVCAAGACSQEAARPNELGNLPGNDGGGHDAHVGVGGGDGGGNGAETQPPACPSVANSCNSLPNCAPKVTVNQVAADPPAPQGGTVPDGTYYMTDYTLFLGQGGVVGVGSAWFRETMVLATAAAGDAGAADAGGPVDGSTGADDAPADGDGLAEGGAPGEGGAPAVQQLQWLDVADSDSSPLTALSGTIDLESTSLTIHYTCPQQSPFGATYTFSGGKLLLFITEPNGETGQATYSKQ
jgi:hypothetical protein